jgi:hypothetical protein
MKEADKRGGHMARKRDINKKFWEEIITYFPMI